MRRAADEAPAKFDGRIFRHAGPLLEQPLSEVTQQIFNLGVAHWLVAKALVPLLKDSPDSGYIIISGAAGVCLTFEGTRVRR